MKVGELIGIVPAYSLGHETSRDAIGIVDHGDGNQSQIPLEPGQVLTVGQTVGVAVSDVTTCPNGGSKTVLRLIPLA